MPEITEFAFFPFKPTHEQDEAAVAALKALGPELRARPGLLGSWYGTPLEKEFSVEFVNGILLFLILFLTSLLLFSFISPPALWYFFNPPFTPCFS
jgi:hypothetical protein